MESSPKVLITIVNWNGKRDLLECLESLKKLNYPKESYEILVIDNASSDGSQEAVRRTYPEISLLENKENLGYVKAVNQGIEEGLNRKVDYIWIFNNDVVVHEDSLRNLVEAGSRNQDIGILAPVIYSYENPSVVDNIGYKIDFWTGRLKKFVYGKDIFEDTKTKISDVDSILGCSNLVKTSVFRKNGFLKPIYNIYFEETDFNVRAKKNGFRVVAVKKAKVWHKNASTMNKFIAKRAYLLLRNLFIFQMHNAEPKHLITFIPYYFLFHVPFFLIRGSAYAIETKLKGRK